MLAAWEDGADVPDVDALPDLDPIEQAWLEVYATLAARRPQSMAGGLLPIPMSEIREYCDLFGFDDRQFFARVIMGIDSLVCAEAHEQKKWKQAESKRG